MRAPGRHGARRYRSRPHPACFQAGRAGAAISTSIAATICLIAAGQFALSIAIAW
jgi:hypothetical protein